jgi:hypothetical protein
LLGQEPNVLIVEVGRHHAVLTLRIAAGAFAEAAAVRHLYRLYLRVAIEPVECVVEGLLVLHVEWWTPLITATTTTAAAATLAHTLNDLIGVSVGRDGGVIAGGRGDVDSSEDTPAVAILGIALGDAEQCLVWPIDRIRPFALDPEIHIAR